LICFFSLFCVVVLKMESGNAEQQQQRAPAAGEATTAAAAAAAATTVQSQQKVQQRVKQLRTEAEAETEKGSEESLRKALALYAEALALVLPPPPPEDLEDDQELPPPTPAAAPLFGGRSTVLIKMEQPEAALLDACYAVSHDPRWAKVPSTPFISADLIRFNFCHHSNQFILIRNYDISFEVNSSLNAAI
jgi:hypothetical protein